jgi:hypothetical protein
MVNKPGFLQFENVFQLALSIMLAAAVAHALNIVSTAIPESDVFIWLISSIVIIIIPIIVICYILDVFKHFKSLQDKNEKTKNLFILIIICVLTLDIFAFSRFIYFLTNPEITSKASNVSLLSILVLTGVLGGVFIWQGKYDKDNKSSLRIIGIMLIIFSFIFYVNAHYQGLGV